MSYVPSFPETALTLKDSQTLGGLYILANLWNSPVLQSMADRIAVVCKCLGLKLPLLEKNISTRYISSHSGYIYIYDFVLDGWVVLSVNHLAIYLHITLFKCSPKLFNLTKMGHCRAIFSVPHHRMHGTGNIVTLVLISDSYCQFIQWCYCAYIPGFISFISLLLSSVLFIQLTDYMTSR